jgi:hypothetical protein
MNMPCKICAARVRVSRQLRSGRIGASPLPLLLLLLLLLLLRWGHNVCCVCFEQYAEWGARVCARFCHMGNLKRIPSRRRQLPAEFYLASVRFSLQSRIAPIILYTPENDKRPRA